VTASRPLGLFEGYGIELEYMIVDHEDLGVRPIADRLMETVAGAPVNELERGPVAWSNELVLHVVELKTKGPAPRLEPLVDRFQSEVRFINGVLEPIGARLMPTAMHPWMDPHGETRLWPHEFNEIYRSYHRIFDCRGHGWSNLQSVHINLPFADDDEFGRLHAAIRIVLPILPALAASSPLADGAVTGLLDTRLEHYRLNSRIIPSVTGEVIPEPVYSRDDYRHGILERMYRDIAASDPDGILQHEWLNSRGAIARFDRDAIEIRVLDIQECPLADLAFAAAISAVIEAHTRERWVDGRSQRETAVAELAPILRATLAGGDRAVIDAPAYLALFGFPGRSCRAAELWQHLFEELFPDPAGTPWQPVLDHYLRHGCLARRIVAASGPAPDRAVLRQVYANLCECLDQGRLFAP
jgi:gamma-glutamyl:cysteine ligase YbdK (ATP-grasp superfamily)